LVQPLPTHERRQTSEPTNADLAMAVAVVDSVTDTEPKEHIRTWGDIVSNLRDAPEKNSKENCKLFTLARFGDVRNPHGSRRHNANVVALSGILGDYDAGAVSVQEARTRLAAAGLEAVVYSTPSHTPEAPRWRVVAPLSKPRASNEHARLVALLNGALGGI